MNKKTIKAIKETLAHWDRMIKWADKQNPKNKVHTVVMQIAIGEVTGCDDCSLCKTYWKNKGICTNCILGERYGICNKIGAKNLFHKTVESKTWGTWTKNAKLFRKQIASLLKKGGMKK